MSMVRGVITLASGVSSMRKVGEFTNADRKGKWGKTQSVCKKQLSFLDYIFAIFTFLIFLTDTTFTKIFLKCWYGKETLFYK